MAELREVMWDLYKDTLTPEAFEVTLRQHRRRVGRIGRVAPYKPRASTVNILTADHGYTNVITWQRPQNTRDRQFAGGQSKGDA
jgi:hypothetical protein